MAHGAESAAGEADDARRRRRAAAGSDAPLLPRSGRALAAMLFSNPDYPFFLIAVFFLYALSRFGGATGRWARIAVMVLLGDLVFLLIAKDPELLWDPLGSVVLPARGERRHRPTARRAVVDRRQRARASRSRPGMRGAPWLASERGQRWVARGLVVIVLDDRCVRRGVLVPRTTLPVLSAGFVAHGHLLVLFVLGVGIGAAQVESHRTLGRVIVLFVASSLFYQAWAVAMPGPYRYLLALLLFTIVLDYYLGHLDREQRGPGVARKAARDRLAVLEPRHLVLLQVRVLRRRVPPRRLILPAGISFHTFQSLSYTIDVYRKQLRATRSPIQFATFVLFFPQLVAGPIVRAQDLLPQLADLPIARARAARRAGCSGSSSACSRRSRSPTRSRSRSSIACSRRPGHFTTLEVLAGVYGYAFQIYLDFSAYSDIAIGSAQVLGFELPENFRTPYRSANLQEFWRRWHISLSTWLRDYLYISLGGSRGARVADVRQPVADDAARRAVARRELDVRRVGRAARVRPRDHAVLPAHARSARDAAVVRGARGGRHRAALHVAFRCAGNLGRARARLADVDAAVGGGDGVAVEGGVAQAGSPRSERSTSRCCASGRASRRSR